MPITEDAPQFGEMEREWQEALRRHIAASSAERTEAVSQWEASVAAMRREQLDLQRAGSWLAGPIDLMGVIGQERQELAHSAAIAWLLDPRMPHGLGSRLLSALASSCYPDEAFAELGQAWTEREVARENARIDILVHAPNLTLVLENKVDALESEGQCDTYYGLFGGDPGARFVFLTPDGRRPQTVSGAAAEKFRSWSYLRLRDALRKALADTAQGPHAAGRPAAEHYLVALDQHFRSEKGQPMSDAPEPRLQFYFKDLDRILEWNRLGNPARELSARVLAESVEDLEARLPEFGASLRLVKGIDPAWPTAFLHDPDWVRTVGSQDFVVGIGLTWQRATILGDPASGPWVGLRIMSPDSEAMSLRTRLKTATAAIRKAKGYEASWVQWAAHRAVPVPKGEWREDLSCFRTAIVDAVQEAWSDLHQAADTTVRTWRGESEARSAQDT